MQPLELWLQLQESGILEFLGTMAIGTGVILALAVLGMIGGDTWWETRFAKPVSLLLDAPFALPFWIDKHCAGGFWIGFSVLVCCVYSITYLAGLGVQSLFT